MGCRCSDVTGFLLTSPAERRYNAVQQAGVAQLVEYKLPKLGVAGSSPVARSIIRSHFIDEQQTVSTLALDAPRSPLPGYPGEGLFA